MRIRILTENTVYRRGLLAEHGLSLIIEEHGKKFLFDTGQSDVYVRNARKLKEDLNDLDGIILSHGHYDHCGGVEYFPGMQRAGANECSGQNEWPQKKAAPGEKKFPPLYVVEGAFKDKRHHKGEKYEVIGIDWKKEDYKGTIIETDGRYEICDGFTLLGKIGYETDFEPTPDGFFIIDGERMPDLMEDEQLLVVDTEKGLSLFMGCSHMGVINCIRRVQREFPGKRIHTILAGMHLKNVPRSRIMRTIEELQKLDFDYLIPVHCTGLAAIVQMKQALGDRCLLAEAGKKFEL